MTEKEYAPSKNEKKMTNKVETPKIKEEINKAPVSKTGEQKKDEKIVVKKEEKKPIKKVKKTEVAVNVKSLPVSTKYAVAICKFIKNKKIENAIKDLEEVVVLKKPVPMKGEIPHRKGKIMSGRFPQRASKEFIVLLKSLIGNANNHEIDNPIIVEAVANLASRPFGRFGRVKRKRTHVLIKAQEKKLIKKKMEKKK